MRPLLKPALHRLWRDATTLQLGIAGPHAVVLAGLSSTDRSLLGLLDGTRDTAALLDAAVDAGADRDAAAALLSTLERAGALDDAGIPSPALGEDDRQRLAPDLLSLSLRHPGAGAATHVLDGRRRAVVAVHGTARVGAEIAMLLAAAGVGTVACLDDGALRQCDLSPGGLARMTAGRRGDITALRASRFTQAVRTTVDRPERATLAVLAPPAAEALPEIVASVRDEPHLLACVRETAGLVGPLVVPGRTPCLRCVALARGDRDPHWPALSAQLVGARTAEPCDVALAGLVASLAALQALAFIDDDDGGEPATAGGVLEYSLATGALRRRSVIAHPACGCGAGRGDDMVA